MSDSQLSAAVPTDDIVIATIPKNAREEIRVALTEFKGYRRISVRLWANTGGGARPTRQDFSLSVEKCPELIAGLGAALKAAAERWGHDGGATS